MDILYRRAADQAAARCVQEKALNIAENRDDDERKTGSGSRSEALSRGESLDEEHACTPNHDTPKPAEEGCRTSSSPIKSLQAGNKYDRAEKL